MRSSTKKFRRLQSSSSDISLTGDSLRRLKTEQLEQNIKYHVESHVLSNLLDNAKELDEFFFTDLRLSSENISFLKSNRLINELIEIIASFFDKYLSSSVLLRCYIYLHVPTSGSASHTHGVNIQMQIIKEIEEMENVIETNENLFIDYFKKHYELVKTLNKYPSIEDYQIYINEYERKMFDDLRLIILELRTIFLKTYDLMTKNLTKIQQTKIDQHLLMID